MFKFYEYIDDVKRYHEHYQQAYKNGASQVMGNSYVALSQAVTVDSDDEIEIEEFDVSYGGSEDIDLT